MEMKKLIDTIEITDLLSTGGIFTKIANTTGQPFTWLTNTYATTLDREYYLSHSGRKWVSHLYSKLLELEDDGTISDANQEIVNMVISKFYDRWEKLYNAYILSTYKPLENYDMEQTETPDITKTETRNSNISTSVTNDITGTDVYGFNSSSPIPQSTITRNGTSSVTADSDDNVTTNTESGTRGLTRHGNIGVTTSQQMLQSEIDLRNSYNFNNQLYDDLDSILCLLVY